MFACCHANATRLITSTVSNENHQTCINRDINDRNGPEPWHLDVCNGLSWNVPVEAVSVIVSTASWGARALTGFSERKSHNCILLNSQMIKDYTCIYLKQDQNRSIRQLKRLKKKFKARQSWLTSRDWLTHHNMITDCQEQIDLHDVI